MEIKFEKQGLLYVAEFEATANFNLHIERPQRGVFTIAQRGTKEGKYAQISDENYDGKTTIDVDMLGSIYPKYIKVTSASMPTYAEVNFGEEGGGGNSGGGSIEYYKIDENLLASIDGQDTDIFTIFPNLVNTGVMISSFTLLMNINPDMTTTEILTSAQGVAFFTDARVMVEGMKFTFNDALEMLGVDISKWQKITEEEFYN